VPGYYCEVHHITDYATCRRTDATNLTFACGPHHRFLRPGGWTTLTRANGETDWIRQDDTAHGAATALALARIMDNPKAANQQHGRGEDSP
jgi:hypothetical protein